MSGKAYSDFWKSHQVGIDTLMQEKQVSCRVGAGAYRKSDTNLYDAIVGVLSKEETTYRIAPTKWCIFYGKGPLSQSLHPLWSRIFLEWFPKNSFQHSGQTEIEVFPSGDTESEDYQFEVWIPLRSAVYES